MMTVLEPETLATLFKQPRGATVSASSKTKTKMNWFVLFHKISPHLPHYQIKSKAEFESGFDQQQTIQDSHRAIAQWIPWGPVAWVMLK